MTPLEDATTKLDVALGRLERALDSVFASAGDPNTARQELDALQADRARLAEDLDASMARERELQTLADEASDALGAAIAEVRAALEREG